MRLIGFSITKISAEKKSTPKGSMNLKSNVDIKDIQKEEIQFTKNAAVKFDFEFTIEYEPKIASINLAGSVIAMDEKDESKEILKDWKKKIFTHPLRVSLFNFIMDKCNLKALQLEDELGLPLHVPLPKLKNQPQAAPNPENTKANYAG